ncbi:DUF3865 domain-containing protein [Nocardia sp. NPDC050718]|uniref:DUF3865 domain-containing protein n=1 Tax=Nocardia sp. NPDC050718 TaxID=3155788 RepID=UPI0033C6B9BA
MTEQDYFTRARVVIHYDHIAVDPARNPAIKAAATLSPAQLGWMIAQYTFLTKAIVGILSTAKENLSCWPEAATELERNIAEELGDGHPDREHFTMFKRGLEDELGIAVSAAVRWPVTETFLGALTRAMSDHRPFVVAGAVYSIEATAVEELKIVRTLIGEYARLSGNLVVRPDGLIHKFLESHICGFEPQHEMGLRQVVGGRLRAENDGRHFLAGCKMVMRAMDNWWAGLATAP